MRSKIINGSYQTEIKHIAVDWIISEGYGCNPIQESDCSGSCYEIDKSSDEYDKSKMEKLEKVNIDLENYVSDSLDYALEVISIEEFQNEFGLNEIYSKEDIESKINELIESVCTSLRSNTIMGGEKAFPELGDNPWKNPETIYTQISLPEISLEDLNPDWNNEEFKLVE